MAGQIDDPERGVDFDPHTRFSRISASFGHRCVRVLTKGRVPAVEISEGFSGPTFSRCIEQNFEILVLPGEARVGKF